MNRAPGDVRDRVVTVPNALSVLRLVLVPVFLYLLLVAHANGWAVAVLMFSGFSDWADGKIARLVDNQSSRLGELLDPAVDRIYMLTVPLAFGVAGIVPWWIVITLIGRDAVLAATLPVLRSRGLTALPVTYIGKGATFALMSAFPLILLGQWDALWSRVILACGWAFLIWGLALYLWSAVLYLIQVGMVMRQMPKVHSRWSGPLGREDQTSAGDIRRPRALGGYDPDAGRNAHEAGAPTLIPVPSLLRSLLSDHLDPGYAAAAARTRAGADPRGRVATAELAGAGRPRGRDGLRVRRRAGAGHRARCAGDPAGAGGQRAVRRGRHQLRDGPPRCAVRRAGRRTTQPPRG